MRLRLSLLVALAFVLMTGMSSCVKKYTCQCNINYTGAPGLPGSVTESYDITDTKANAKSKCSAQSATYNNNGIQTVETCTLY
jgi:hypothetical protein